MDSGSSETRAAAPISHPIPSQGFAPGTILAGRYRIVALAGRGGMGEVYRADDLKLGQPVALKFLPAELETDPAARDRLLAEARHARAVSHPNVCRVYDIGDIDGRAFLTMEYIDGEDLASLLRRIGRLPAPKALDVARQLCAGLSAAHDRGLLHRDLKPANVMIDGRGQARITDFGLAVEASSAGPTGDVSGTLAYLAPERFQGAPATVQSDLYALGLTLYETCTGRAPFTAATVGEWQQAHSTSRPSMPSSHVGDIEPAVERAILRCLEKDPARRPASAAQVAAALPGGDPLSAAVAAGETPSPELVAASGEEGTLPRWQAWTWLAACVAALAVAALSQIPFRLSEHVPMDLAAAALQARARELIRDLGYPDEVADSAWWVRADEGYLARLARLRPGEASAHLRAAAPGPLLFCYRQSSSRLVPLGALGRVTAVDPPPRAGDAYVELDPAGRLVTLRVKPAASEDAPASGGVNWTPLFAAARLGPPGAFAPVAPQRWPDGAADAREACEGRYAGQTVRVEAAARAGRPVFFCLVTPWLAAPDAGTAAGRVLTPPMLAQLLLFWISFLLLAGLARRNLRLGRSDRAAAKTLAIAVIVAWSGWIALASHSAATLLDLFGGPGVLAQPLLFGLFAWLAYLALEPQIRRAWPHLLIASTRLLGGRWRDPLVGRAVLAGVLVGLVYSLPGSVVIARMLDLPGGGPTEFLKDSLDGFRLFIGWQMGLFAYVLLFTLSWLTVLLVARLIVRRADAAWLIFVLAMSGYSYLALRAGRPDTINPAMLLSAAVVFSLLPAWLLWKHGALALAAAFLVSFYVENCPWTLDAARWYSGQGWITAALIAALALWGFRNVLGKQTLFPAGTLDG